MKKFLCVVAMLITAGVAFALLGSIIAVGIGAAILYYSYKKIITIESLFKKVLWCIAGLIGVSIMLRSIPGIIGLGAIALLYYLYKILKGDSPTATTYEHSEYNNFEEQWKTIMCEYK